MRKSDQKLTTLDLTDEMGRRVATWLRAAYPRNGAKGIARDTGASPHTARKWLAGVLPENKHMAMMASRWGARFLAYVYEPAIGTDTLLAARTQLQDLRAQLDQLEADLDRTGAHSVRGEGGAAAVPDPQDARAPWAAVRPLELGSGRDVARPVASLDGGRP